VVLGKILSCITFTFCVTEVTIFIPAGQPISGGDSLSTEPGIAGPLDESLISR